ncbi:2OG-Fe(II) oxygenase [Sphingomonas sp.]|uniref:prolyl hydroxylase family protein n=1 Tax=Sphingomonas sp. TaxID=28214 RepID=UPI002B9A2FAB|nr:2OG-Fe(II) oxygenase [Sphingomonas sp.]HWK36294.1 2OG-Fe(II) oxygenase [Sphingomonas sp.]
MNVVEKKPGSTSRSRARLGSEVSARLSATPNVKRAKIDTADVFYLMNFVTDEECETLIRVIDAGRRPSTLLAYSSDPSFRTSESCDFQRFSPDIEPIEQRVCDLMGIALPHGETMQGQRYASGQQFRAHHDYFHENTEYWPRMMKEGGQRTWTAMIYLNDVEEGGSTWFPQAGIRIPPRKRMLLMWNNMKPDGSPNPNTLHEGMAVTKGVKYVVTKWFREEHWYREN